MISRWIISAALLVALALTSWGHHMLPPGKQAQLEAYVLAGGDLGALCTDGTGPAGIHKECPACVISQGCALPGMAIAARQIGQSIATRGKITAVELKTAAAYAPHAARAPPFV
ncbi:hypothetical protein [Yoonia sp. BS5-3]|uniref:DUF2946 domain-containing protein n=1 Tax=Yoonia phaeophyticola TaxID=3137369 RepID=A0ABZ2V0D8_9RHOB